jgi:hypothetical protein
MSRRAVKRDSKWKLRRLINRMMDAPRRRDGQPPIFELQSLEQRMYLSLAPMIYSAISLPDGPAAAPAVTVYFNATGTQASQVTSVKVNFGDYVNGAPDIQSFTVPTGTSYPFALVPSGSSTSHTYLGQPGNYAITATAYISNTAYTAGGLSVDPAFGATVNGVQTGTSTDKISNGSNNDAGYGVAIDVSGTPAGNPNYGKIYIANTDGGQFAVSRYNANGTPGRKLQPECHF